MDTPTRSEHPHRSDRSAPSVDHGALTRAVLDLLTVRRVFGEAYERDGVQVIPVAKVLGGTGAGYGSGEGGDPADGKDAGYGYGSGEGGDPADGKDAGYGYGSGEGGGGGFGVRLQPVGVYVLDGHGVHWRPALDVNRIVLGGQLLGMVAMVALSRALRRRRG